jgi:oxygen-independent coproporphyrinogen-3 oxidase
MASRDFSAGNSPGPQSNLSKELGLYIHIPFCIKKCDYCDFYSLPGRLHSIDSYIQSVLEEARKYQGLSFQTLYLGGGTPSLLCEDGLPGLMKALNSVFDLSGVVEATIEANPDSVTFPFLEAAQIAGINRISIGVQSLSDIELEKVGRVHTAAQAVQALTMTKDQGFLNISADVILGLPAQDWASLMVTLETLIALNIQHISLYCLSIEPHTPLGIRMPADLPSDDEQAELYSCACDLLQKRGFTHYEISNFALPGYECRHNLNYWRGGEYLGLGPAAASHLERKRFRNKPDLDAYLLNPLDLIEEEECLDSPAKAAEEAILRLRLLREGLDLDRLSERFGSADIKKLQERLDRLVEKDLLIKAGFNYRLPPNCALVSNPILCKILGD